MKDRTAEFLATYKEIELLCRNQGKDVKDIELELGKNDYDPDASKLVICRQLRNFITHNDVEGFILISPGMIKFLKELKKDLIKVKDKKKISIDKSRYSK